MKILVLSRYGRLGASSRLRTFQYLPLLENAGISCTVHALFSDDMLSSKYQLGNYSFATVLRVYIARIWELLHRQRFDLIWIEKEALPWLPARLESSLLRGIPYVLDYDDALFHNYDRHRSRWIRRFFGQRLDYLMARSRLVLCGNDYLAQRARDAGAPWVEVIPTVIDLDRYKISMVNEIQRMEPRVVWIGSPSTTCYLASLEASLSSLSRYLSFKLRVIGATVDMPGVNVECVRWSEDSEVASIAQCDVGVMPLSATPWELGKCGYKLIQYMACSLPVVASPVGVNVHIVRNGENGFLANSVNSWTSRLQELLCDPELRKSMGNVGRQSVEAKYCLQKMAPWMATLLLKAGESVGCVL